MKQLWLVALAVGIAFGCNSSPTPKESSDKATLKSESSAALDAFKNADPSLSDLMDKALGYAIFPDVGKAGFIAGGSYGKGEVYEGGKLVGYSDISQATIGLQAGAQTFAELILFLRPQELENFKGKDFALAANLSAVIIKAGAAKTADTSKGMVVFVRSKGGAMVDASIGGQRFRFQPISAPPTTQP